MKIRLNRESTWTRYEDKLLMFDLIVSESADTTVVNMKFTSNYIELPRVKERLYKLCNEFLKEHLNEFDQIHRQSLADRVYQLVKTGEQKNLAEPSAMNLKFFIKVQRLLGDNNVGINTADI